MKNIQNMIINKSNLIFWYPQISVQIFARTSALMKALWYKLDSWFLNFDKSASPAFEAYIDEFSLIDKKLPWILRKNLYFTNTLITEICCQVSKFLLSPIKNTSLNLWKRLMNIIKICNNEPISKTTFQLNIFSIIWMSCVLYVSEKWILCEVLRIMGVLCFALLCHFSFFFFFLFFFKNLYDYKYLFQISTLK